jgi:hypothetical protein
MVGYFFSQNLKKNKNLKEIMQLGVACSLLFSAYRIIIIFRFVLPQIYGHKWRGGTKLILLRYI